MWKSVASNALTLLIVGIFLLGGLVLWGKDQYTGPGPLAEAICVRVQPGARMGSVTNDLEEKGAVTSASIMRIGADYSDKTDQLKAGSFLVQPGASMEEIVDIITRGGANSCGSQIIYRIGVTSAQAEVRDFDAASGRYVEKAEFDLSSGEPKPEDFTRLRNQSDTAYRVVVAEGVTSWQVVEALNAMDVLAGEAGEVPTEGALAPHSYEIVEGTDRKALLEQMTALQSQRLAAAWEGRDPDLPLQSPAEMLILASIIEKETGQAGERDRIAGVFIRRLEKGMLLQTDPTVIYGIEEFDGNLRRRDLEADGPYNTYKRPGLPPTPIALPGRAALEAAVQPADDDALYFVSRGDGTHVFSRTYEAHRRAVREYQLNQ